MNKDRFANILGSDYNLFNNSVPHHDALQGKIGEIIKNYCSNLKSEDILAVEGGCGTGITTIHILEADRRINIIGIDNEEKTINQARAVLKDYENRINLREEDLLTAIKSIPDRSIDIFVSVWVIHNLTPEYRRLLFPEIARILKSGGLFISGDKYAQNIDELHTQSLVDQIKAFDVFDTLKRSDLKEEWTKHYLEDDKIKIKESEQIKILESLGFEEILIQYRKGMEAVISGICQK